MNKKVCAQAFTAGLLAGYGGQTKFQKTSRGGFEISSSHYEKDDINYHDEWTNGGGQEIVETNGNQYTRVYAGGAAGEIKEIIAKLIYFIQELKDKTRLFSDCGLKDGDWDYEYKIIDTNEELNITVGKETIKYKNQIVFIHIFVLSSIIN